MDFLGIDESKENALEIKFGAPRLNEKRIIIVVSPILHRNCLKIVDSFHQLTLSPTHLYLPLLPPLLWC